jgi:hypothetical protein
LVRSGRKRLTRTEHIGPARVTARPGSVPTTPPTRRGPTEPATRPGAGSSRRRRRWPDQERLPSGSGARCLGRASRARGRSWWSPGRDRPSSVPDPAAHAVNGFHRVDLAEMLAAIRALARPHSAPLSWGPRLCVGGAREGPGAAAQALPPKCARRQASPRGSPTRASRPECTALPNVVKQFASRAWTERPIEAGRPAGARGRGEVGSGGEWRV